MKTYIVISYGNSPVQCDTMEKASIVSKELQLNGCEATIYQMVNFAPKLAEPAEDDMGDSINMLLSIPHVPASQQSRLIIYLLYKEWVKVECQALGIEESSYVNDECAYATPHFILIHEEWKYSTQPVQDADYGDDSQFQELKFRSEYRCRRFCEVMEKQFLAILNDLK